MTTKEELLEKAKKDYPVGTVFHPPHVSKKDVGCIVVDTDFTFSADDIVSKIEDHLWNIDKDPKYGLTSFNRYLYWDGKWAEISSKPEESPGEKLLREAKERYPIGTWFTPVRVSSVPEVYEIVSHTPYYPTDQIENVGFEGKCVKGSSELKWIPNVYHRGTWAKIVAKPVEFEEDIPAPVKTEPQFEVGKWYASLSSNGWKKFLKLQGSEWHYSEEIYDFGDGYKFRISKNFARLSCRFELLSDLSGIQQYLPEGHVDKTPTMKELTELPEKWCIRGGEKLKQSRFRLWSGNPRNLTGNSDSYYHYDGEKIIDYWNEIKVGYTEITFDQFKKWVLKESAEEKAPVRLKFVDLVEGEVYRYNYSENDRDPVIGKCTENKSSSAIAIRGNSSDYWNPGRFSSATYMTKATEEEKHWLEACIKVNKFVSLEDSKKVTESVVPEYVECIKLPEGWGNYTKVGGVYKTDTSKYSYRILYSEGSGQSTQGVEDHFKPSTKEAYDDQEKKKTMKVEEDLTGRYIKCLDDHAKGHYPCHKGDYLKFVSSKNSYEYWGACNKFGISDGTENPRYHGKDVHKSPAFELMPVGFVPPVEKSVEEKWEPKVGEYAVMVDAGGWGYKHANNGCIGIIKSVGVRPLGKSYGDISVPSISGNLLNPVKSDEWDSFENIPVHIGRGIIVCRRALPHEIPAPEPVRTIGMEEILEEARRRYPKGTQYIPTSRNNSRHADTSCGEFKIATCGRLEDKVLSTGIYDGGKWAEIISTPVEDPLEIRRCKFIDWYQKNLPPHIASAASSYFDATFTVEVEPLIPCHYLSYGFKWKDTSEGHAYWERLNSLIHDGADISRFGMVEDRLGRVIQSEPAIELIVLKTTTI